MRKLKGNKTERVWLAAQALHRTSDYITPKLLAMRSGYEISARISQNMDELEAAGKIKRVRHSWHDVEVKVFPEKL